MKGLSNLCRKGQIISAQKVFWVEDFHLADEIIVMMLALNRPFEKILQYRKSNVKKLLLD